MKNKRYRQLRRAERDRIFSLMRKGKTQEAIAEILGRDKSTISREISRNRHLKFKIYLPDTAQRKADKSKAKGRKSRYMEKDPQLRRYVIEKFKLGWSPEQIEGRIEKEVGKYINYETLYQYIYSLQGRKKNLKRYLRRSHRIRHNRNGRRHQKGKIPNRVDIAFRPRFIEGRRQLGHWEGDSMYFKGHSQQLATFTERKSRFTIAIRPKDRSAQARADATVGWFGQLPNGACRTMTFDNGLELASHQAITRSLCTKVYFAKPYASWQRGTNENSNGLIRWYLPHNTDLDSLTNEQLNNVINLINSRPRKCLAFRTPYEVLLEEMGKIKNKFRNVSISNLCSHLVALEN